MAVFPEVADDDPRQQAVRVAARALGRAGLATAYGHCSLRLDASHFLVCRPGPLGTIRPGEAGSVVRTTGPLPAGVLGEVRVHQAIYARRPEIGAICRMLPPQLMALSVLGQVPGIRHGFGAYFHPGAAFWDDPALLRNDVAAAGVAETLGSAPAIVLRGNGAVVVAENLPRAVALCWYLEDAARIELAVLAAGRADEAPRLSDAEARARANWDGRAAERLWDWLSDGDPEAAGAASVIDG